MSERLHDGHDGRGRLRLRRAITIPRGGLEHAWMALLLASALISCAPAKPPVSQPPIVAVATAEGTAEGTGGPRALAVIAAVRPIPASGTASSDPDAAILPAMGVASPAVIASRVAPASEAPSEIILRTAAGDTLSVIQFDAADLSPGETVMILQGASGRRLVPVPPRI